MSLTAGTKLGSYEVLDHIGAGGMGEVYRARDAKLGREVNINVTPEDSVKLLDFGLAKAFEEDPDASTDLSQSPTLTRGTAAGERDSRRAKLAGRSETARACRQLRRSS